MIYFEAVRYKNLLSTGNTFTEIRLDRNPKTLVMGKNGSGKSTMLDALMYVLFNKAFRNINKPNLINSINNSDLVVEVDFKSGLKSYRVVRGQKPNIFEIYEDGKLINQDAKSTDYQKYLEKTILNFTAKSFTQIVIIGSSSFVPFMKLAAHDRRTIIEDLLDIEIFSVMDNILNNKMRIIKETAFRVKTDITALMSSIEMQKQYVEDAKKNAADSILKKNIELSNNQQEISRLTDIVNNLQSNIGVLLTQISDEEKVRYVIKQLETFRIKIEGNIASTKKEIVFFNSNDDCPKCRQTIQNKQEVIETCIHKLKESESGLDKLETERLIHENRLTSITDIRKQISSSQNEITKCLASISEIQKYTNRLVLEIAELSNKKPISEDMLNVSKDLILKLEKLNQEKSEIIDRKHIYETAALLLKDNGIKAKIIKQYLPIINKMVNKYLTSMDFFVNFNIDEEFKETIKSRHRDIFSYDNFSEGEKLRIDMALLFTWRAIAKIKNSMNTNLLILDEIFDGSLDSAGTEEFMKLLDTFGKEANIFVVSHKGDILADKFSHVLRFEKKSNFSEVV